MIHFDEARHRATEKLRQLEGDPLVERALLVDDLFGRIRIVLWLSGQMEPTLFDALSAGIREAAGEFWSEPLFLVEQRTPEADRLLFESLWDSAEKLSPKVGRTDRHRSRGFWFQPPSEPKTPIESCAVVSFYSFKGGVGRSTAVAAFALQRSRAGEQVAVLDLDLDAPGVGLLLDPGNGVPGSPWGVLDYLIEQPILDKVELSDYYHRFGRKGAGDGDILVFPAAGFGQADEPQERTFLQKLARVDLEPLRPQHQHPLDVLIGQVTSDLKPTWILLDCRAGLSDISGFALSGIAHLNVLFGTTSEFSWLGLRYAIARFGQDRIRVNRPQADCILVQGMVPEAPLFEDAQRSFKDKARDVFAELYYAADPESPSEDDFWYVSDMGSQDAPHVPVPIRYRPPLALFSSVDQVADELCRDDYAQLGERIVGRCNRGEE